MKKELREDLKFYLDRFHYYYNVLVNAAPDSGWKGFGEVEFYHKDYASIEWTYEYWLNGMVGFIEKAYQDRKKEKRDDKKRTGDG